MRTDKDYPATHSMSTAWYIVDDEGNVGIMDYNDNGPVPEDASCGDYIPSLIWGHEFGQTKRQILLFNLTLEQIHELLEEPHSPQDERNWFDCIVRIDKSKERVFLKLCRNYDISRRHIVCVSEKYGLYDFDAYDCCHTKNGEYKRIRGTLKKMIKEKMILEVYPLKNYDIDDDFVKNKPVHIKNFSSLPYYVYHQPYSNEFLPERMSTPINPIKLEQIPESFRKRLHKIPGLFKDLDTFQIAEFHPCSMLKSVWENNTIEIEGQEYEILPDSNGIMYYIATKDFLEGKPIKYSIEEVEILIKNGKAKVSNKRNRALVC